MSTFRIVVACFEGCLPSGIAGLVDLFFLANIALDRQPGDHARFEVSVASDTGKAIRDGRQQRVAVDGRLSDIVTTDAVLIPGFWSDADHLDQVAATFQSVRSWLRSQYLHGAWVGSSCSGAYVLGEAGLLDGRRCTTTWWLHDAMQRRYPKADVARGAPLAEDERIVTTGGPMSWVGLALHIMRVLAGPEIARTVSSFAVLDAVPLNQAVYLPVGPLSTTDAFLIKAEQCIRQTQDGSINPSSLAATMSVSSRTLHRRLKAMTGETPNTFIARVRIEGARMLLDTSDTAIKEIALTSGYQDEGTFRRVFRTFYGLTPTGYRRWTRQRRAGGSF